MAGGAGAGGGDVVFPDMKPEAGDEESLARGAKRVFVLPHPAGKVAGIDVAQPGRLADPSRFEQGKGGGVVRV